MRIGIMAGATDGPGETLGNLLAQVKDAETRGFDTVWLANIFGLDAITSLALAGRETSRIELGTAVVPTYPRHPTAMAQQALTAAAASAGRFVLGIGLSHKIVIEDMLGYSYEQPAKHMREYLEVLLPLLAGEPIRHRGEAFKVAAQIQVAGVTAPPVLVAALGPVMLKIAGSMADGTITWMTGPRTLETHIGPVLRKAAEQAGRPEPRIVAGFPVAVTDDVDGARQAIAQSLAIYGQLPSYRAMLDREGLDGPADLALVGDEATVTRDILRLRDLGVTDFDAAIVPVADGVRNRTLEMLQTLL